MNGEEIGASIESGMLNRRPSFRRAYMWGAKQLFEAISRRTTNPELYLSQIDASKSVIAGLEDAVIMTEILTTEQLIPMPFDEKYNQD